MFGRIQNQKAQGLRINAFWDSLVSWSYNNQFGYSRHVPIPRCSYHPQRRTKMQFHKLYGTVAYVSGQLQ